ncbi:MAG: putative metal binding protein [Candidatus Methanohalarchaeum thermophilum]|uniref:UPF0179 protein BTN85_1649 n=1 Tax=Methanohalarchaeum thermophilum TaxID=1903181 RepID=A0A1Q6DXV0_METT1|nr:MAG: putative metal binding protein [Candidatus Methanohalarchaeum thermophilum]
MDVEEAERKVTLVGKRISDVGTEFVFYGSASECESCGLKNSCINLEEGKKYRIVGKRETNERECSVHAGGVEVVEVIESPVIATVKSNKAIEGSKITYEMIECNNRKCDMHRICQPEGIEDGDKCKIKKVIGDIPSECEKGLDLSLVELKP